MRCSAPGLSCGSSFRFPRSPESGIPRPPPSAPAPLLTNEETEAPSASVTFHLELEGNLCPSACDTAAHRRARSLVSPPLSPAASVAILCRERFPFCRFLSSRIPRVVVEAENTAKLQRCAKRNRSLFSILLAGHRREDSIETFFLRRYNVAIVVSMSQQIKNLNNQLYIFKIKSMS